MKQPVMKKLTAADPETKSADLIADNVERLKALLPEAFTEGKIDFEVLKQLLGGAVEEREEKYGLSWYGKRQARQLALTPSTGTLRPRPEESVDWDQTKNLLIEGDNLEVLKLLQKSYAGKVKVIYIDPPYNTGKDFVYRDSFQDNVQNYLELTQQIESGARITSNVEHSGRFHTDWLNMLYPRLQLARQLLSEDGMIFVSIDDAEAPRLRAMMDELFGEENFQCQFIWRSDGNFDNQAKFKICHEYVIAYARNAELVAMPPVVDPSVPKDSKLFLAEIRNTIIKNGPKNPVSEVVLPPGFPAAFREGEIPPRSDSWPRFDRKIQVAEGRLRESVAVSSGWSSREMLVEYIEGGFQPIADAKGQETSFVMTASGAIEAIKKRTGTPSHVLSVISGVGGPQKATAQLAEIGAVFDGYPKPVALVSYLLSMVVGVGDLVVDFFAGSGTTGHAVFELNAKNAAGLRFVLVQLPEPLSPDRPSQAEAAAFCDSLGKPRSISELTKQRLRLASSAVKASLGRLSDLGFRSFRLDSSNLRAWSSHRENFAQTLEEAADHLKTGRTEQDILYELLLKLGLDLCVPIETRQISGHTVHSVGAGALFACLSEKLTRQGVEPLAEGLLAWHRELKPAVEPTCVFRDAAFVDDVAKTNLAAILQQNGLTNVRSL